jgi:hypothetical protein
VSSYQSQLLSTARLLVVETEKSSSLEEQKKALIQLNASLTDELGKRRKGSSLGDKLLYGAIGAGLGIAAYAISGGSANGGS